MAISNQYRDTIINVFTKNYSNYKQSYGADDLDYGVYSDGREIFSGERTLKINSNGSRNNNWTSGFNVTGVANAPYLAMGSVYKDNVTVFLSHPSNGYNYGYIKDTFLSSPTTISPVTTIDYRSKFGNNILANQNNFWIGHGLEDGLWIMEYVSGGSRGTVAYNGYTYTQKLTGTCRVKLKKYDYKNLNLLNEITVNLPNLYFQTGEDSVIGGFELAGVFVINLTGNQFAIICLDDGSIAGTFNLPISSLSGNQPLTFSYLHGVIAGDGGDNDGDSFIMIKLNDFHNHPELIRTNEIPKVPSSLSPTGFTNSPETISTLTPTLSWVFADDDEGDVQGKLQVQIFKALDNSLAHDTGALVNGSASYTVPQGTLEPDTKYYWKVRVWDNNDDVSEYTTNRYFVTTKAPSINVVSPIGSDSVPVKGISVIPRLEWTYSDDENHGQTHIQVVIKDSDAYIVHDTGKIACTDKYYNVPAGVLYQSEKYSWAVTVWDSTDMKNTPMNPQYFITNYTPQKPTAPMPIDNYRVPLRPTFEFTAPIDVEDDKLHFKLNLSLSDTFESTMIKDSGLDTTGWEYQDGDSWVAIPAEGLASEFYGRRVRYTFTEDLTEKKTYYWRVTGYNRGLGSPKQYVYSDTKRIRVGDRIVYQETPYTTTDRAERILAKIFMNTEADGVKPVSYTIEVCNNALDENPTWEDMTQSVKQKKYHVFANQSKTATDWAVSYKLTVMANDTMGKISVESVSICFD
ncbi:hypothetical protein PV797_05380 [Clostridiaceae bacterium M8S5]|nr:hypothetical protein PV797_05380 [Clostridiaceae bacterium M8S5]